MKLIQFNYQNVYVLSKIKLFILVLKIKSMELKLKKKEKLSHRKKYHCDISIHVFLIKYHVS